MKEKEQGSAGNNKDEENTKERKNATQEYGTITQDQYQRNKDE